ncbi:hypothetical protein [Micromonospora sp. NPDC023644]|uniref:hypothetical protein n=1 Tax=Micromonospora sp. NPDC023644 TaxID=3154321 RepID=UPI0033F7C7D7
MTQPEVRTDRVGTVAVAGAADQAKRRLTARHPAVRYVFLDPTGTAGPATTRGRTVPAADRRPGHAAPGAPGRGGALACRAWCDGGRER